MTIENSAPTADVSTDLVDSGEPVEVDASDADSNDAEYLAEMAKIRGNSKEDEAGDEELDEEEREYREAMAKAKASAKEEKKEAKEKKEKSSEKKDEKGSGKIWKLKVYDKEVEFDASDETKVQQAVQKGLAADKVFADSSKIKKQAENFVRALRTNFEEVLQHKSLGIEEARIRKFCEDYLYEKVRHEQMSPEEKAHAQEKQELEIYRREKAQREAEEKARAKEENTSKLRGDWEKKFIKVLEEADFPATDWSVSRMAYWMKVASARGHKHIQPADVVDLVREDWTRAQSSMYSKMSDSQLLTLLGKENIDRVRKANLARLDREEAAAKPRPQEDAKIEKSKQRIYSSVDEMLRDRRSA